MINHVATSRTFGSEIKPNQSRVQFPNKKKNVDFKQPKQVLTCSAQNQLLEYENWIQLNN